MKSLLEHMKNVPDPRCSRKKMHESAEILTCLVAGYLCGMTSLRRCLGWAKMKLCTLRKHMSLTHGIASVSTVSRLLSSIDEELFLCVFMEWVGEILDSKGCHVAIDGKALCAAGSKVKGERAPLLLNAIDVATGLVLGQLPLKDKPSEITAIPRLLELLDIRGSIITIDAVGTQTQIMEQIRDQGGHFVLLVKKNQPSAYEEILETFDALEKEKKNLAVDPHYKGRYPDLISKYEREQGMEKNRDRYEYREYSICNDPSILTKAMEEWVSIKSVGCIRQTRILLVKNRLGEDITPSPGQLAREGSSRQPLPEKGDGEKADFQVVGVVSDMEMTAKEMGRYKRSHWLVENRLHHVLDDTFREDRSPAKGSRNNLALIRKFAYNILRIAKDRERLTNPMTEIMDLFAFKQGMMEKYLFNGIESYY